MPPAQAASSLAYLPEYCTIPSIALRKKTPEDSDDAVPTLWAAAEQRGKVEIFSAQSGKDSLVASFDSGLRVGAAADAAGGRLLLLGGEDGRILGYDWREAEAGPRAQWNVRAGRRNKKGGANTEVRLHFVISRDVTHCYFF